MIFLLNLYQFFVSNFNAGTNYQNLDRKLVTWTSIIRRDCSSKALEYSSKR